MKTSVALAIVFLLGLAAITAGVTWLVHPGAGLITGGTMAAYVAYRLETTRGGA